MLISLSKFCCRKETLSMQKFEKKRRRRKKKEKKWTQRCLEYLKEWVLRCPPQEKKRRKKIKMNKDCPYSLAKYFQVSRERFLSRSIVELGWLPYISIKHSTYMHILIWLYDIFLFGSIVWPYNICIASMLSSFIPTFELHKGSRKKRQ